MKRLEGEIRSALRTGDEAAIKKLQKEIYLGYSTSGNRARDIDFAVNGGVNSKIEATLSWLENAMSVAFKTEPKPPLLAVYLAGQEIRTWHFAILRSPEIVLRAEGPVGFEKGKFEAVFDCPGYVDSLTVIGPEHHHWPLRIDLLEQIDRSRFEEVFDQGDCSGAEFYLIATPALNQFNANHPDVGKEVLATRFKFASVL